MDIGPFLGPLISLIFVSRKSISRNASVSSSIRKQFRNTLIFTANSFLKFHKAHFKLTYKIFWSSLNPAGRAFTSDWLVNSFIMVFHEKNILRCAFGLKILTEFGKKNLISNHYKIIYSPVRSDCSSCKFVYRFYRARFLVEIIFLLYFRFLKLR